METTERPRVLCVDDEPNVLKGLQRTLRRSFEVTAAVGALEGLTALESSAPYAVVVSDLRMPVMDGISFLERARAISPDTIRVLLSGDADLHAALGAVNRGAIFRFLLKPATPDDLVRALLAAVEQHRLVTAERVLLEQTLHGSIRALTEILALVNPAGFGRAARAKATVGEMAASVGAAERWQVEVAAMLSQLGTVTLPQSLVEKIYAGRTLTYSESVSVERLPRIACEVVAGIPRLEEVQRILSCLGARFDGEGAKPGVPSGEAIPWGARALRLALDFDVLESQGVEGKTALDTLRSRVGWYDPALLERLVECTGYGPGNQQVIEIELRAVRPGMVFAEDVRTISDILLVARGQEVTERLAERLKNFLHLVEAKQQVRVIVPNRRLPAGDAAVAAVVQ